MSDDLATLASAVVIDRRSGEPVFRQLARQIHDLVIAGELRTGTRLPAERELARAFGVGRATMARALTELADSGLIERRVGRGTVVAFDLETWRAGPTPGIPWGALLTTVAPPAEYEHMEKVGVRARRGISADLDVADRGAESIILTGGSGDGTRFLVESLVRAGDRVIVAAPAAPGLRTALAMRAAETIEVGGAGEGFVAALERLLEARPGAKLVWLQDGAGLRGRGDLAHLAGLTKRFGLPVIEERRGVGAAEGLLRVEPHDHVVRLDDGWISVPSGLARLMRPLAMALGVGPTSDG